MASGVEKYYQIAPCFRDEAGRSDRSPGEFYQLDLEIAFGTQEDVFNIVETLLTEIFMEYGQGIWQVNGSHWNHEWTTIPYKEAMLKYGTDKPDLRNPLIIQDVSDIFKESEFRAFKTAVDAGSVVRCIAVKGIATRARAWYDKMVGFAQELGARGLAYVIWSAEGAKGPIAKFLKPEHLEAIKSRCNVGDGDTVFFLCDTVKNAPKFTGQIRTKLADDLDLIDPNVFRFCWIVDFPMYELDEATGEIVFSHNPFSMPQGGHEALNNQDPLTLKAYQYDVVCNGVELSSGAVRNHVPEAMYRAFEIAGYGPEAVDEKFGGMIRAFQFGAPPHAGIAPGIDRIVMLLAGESNIREIIAFPLNQKAQCLLMGAPAEASEKQLKEIHIKLAVPQPGPANS